MLAPQQMVAHRLSLSMALITTNRQGYAIND
ncbi:hypothetical protein LVISKB_2386 [Levilactobacillus brevis KB290]|uniref:Uncharacterized protein n=1 Tax=Levilactobacillus brevis KB290 TaxID=1001583 RepID=M5B1L4_LEVBR|nr:hypothetical protein LVISKB_2386 [Levilactobacillus brevis KB290]